VDTEQIFEAALNIAAPWHIMGLKFVPSEDTGIGAGTRRPGSGTNKTKGKGSVASEASGENKNTGTGKGTNRITHKGVLHVTIDFEVGARFAVPGVEGLHPVHDTMQKTYQHMDFFQHQCFFEVRVPRVKLPDGSVRLVSPPWEGKLSGLTLLFESYVLLLCQEMPFAGVARATGLSQHRVMALCSRYVDAAVSLQDYSEVRDVALDDTSRATGQNYITIFADAQKRRVIFVAEGREADTVEAFVKNLVAHHGRPSLIENVSIDMAAPYISGVETHLPNAVITFDKFHVIAHASEAVDEVRRQEQRLDPSLKGMRWTLLKDRKDLTAQQRADLDKLVSNMTTSKVARAWHYREQLREILSRLQVNVVRGLLHAWVRNVLRSKVEPMKKVARMIREHFTGVLAWVESRQTNGFLEAINGLFQAAKRRARGYGSFLTIRTVVFLIAGKLDFSTVNPCLGAG
jgi:transposase